MQMQTFFFRFNIYSLQLAANRQGTLPNENRYEGFIETWQFVTEMSRIICVIKSYADN